MSKIDTKGLALLVAEANDLTNKKEWSKQDERRNAYLLSAISAVKAGATLAEIDLEEVNETERRAGLPVTRRQAPVSETRAKAEAWATALQVMRENRTATQTEGNIIARVGTTTGLQSFVPVEFITDTFAALGAHDAFWDEDAVSVMNSTDGRVTQIPLYGDIENVGAPVGEAANTTSSEALIASPGQANVAAYSYRSPLWRLSLETATDVTALGGVLPLFKQFAADRIARGAARKLVNGSGSGEPLGIIPSLIAAGVTPVTAVGSADNTGLTQDGTNSIGSKDLAATYLSVNEAYRQSPKCAWFMNDNTRLFLSQIVTKMGVPLIQVCEGVETIYGKPIRISPSMDNIGVSKMPVLFGDGSYWLTRKIVDDNSYVQLVREAAGLIENGEVALRMFARYDGVLLYKDAGSPAPFGILQNHS